jgi:rubrerythrin
VLFSVICYFTTILLRNKYTYFSSKENKEGFNDIALQFELVEKIEKEHEERYLKLFKNIEDSTVFTKKQKSVWICRNCGYIVDSENAPYKCQVCAHPQSYFELRAENY